MSAKVARIIKEVSLQSQTASVPTTTLVTPGEAKMFRVSVAGSQSGPGDAICQVNWTDDLSSQMVNTTLGLGTWTTFAIHSVAGQPVTFDVGLFPGPSTYNCYITLEEL